MALVNSKDTTESSLKQRSSLLAPRRAAPVTVRSLQPYLASANKLISS